MKEEGEAIQGEIVPLGTIEAKGPADIVARGAAIATELKAIIDDRKLYTEIGDKQFLDVIIILVKDVVKEEGDYKHITLNHIRNIHI